MSNTMPLRNMYEKIIRNNGWIVQAKKAKQECEELAFEISIAIIDKVDHDSILDECADVRNCIGQLQIMFGISDEKLEQRMKEKMERTMLRIEEEKNL